MFSGYAPQNIVILTSGVLRTLGLLTLSAVVPAVARWTLTGACHHVTCDTRSTLTLLEAVDTIGASLTNCKTSRWVISDFCVGQMGLTLLMQP